MASVQTQVSGTQVVCAAVQGSCVLFVIAVHCITFLKDTDAQVLTLQCLSKASGEWKHEKQALELCISVFQLYIYIKRTRPLSLTVITATKNPVY